MRRKNRQFERVFETAELVLGYMSFHLLYICKRQALSGPVITHSTAQFGFNSWQVVTGELTMPRFINVFPPPPQKLIIQDILKPSQMQVYFKIYLPTQTQKNRR